MSKFNYLLLLFLLFTVAFAPAYSQTGTITGKVQNEKTDEYLPGATVELVELPIRVDAKKKGAIANQDAEFVIRGIKPGKYKLVIHYVGYKNYEETIAVKENDNIVKTIKLIPDVIGLDEIVVTGVASRREKAVSDVSVARINAEELQEMNTYQDLSQVLSGKVPGVQVQSASGNVGGGMRFQVRGGGGLNGSGQPVIFIDGTRIANSEIGVDISGQFASTLSDLNPEDIASVEVLKGPAGAALYGTSGSNGVVLITTKRGRKGGETFQANYTTNSGWNEQAVEYSKDKILSADAANGVFRQGNYFEHTLSFSGKSGLFNYYAGYSKRDEEGIVIGNKYGRESFRGNFEFIPTDEWSLKFSGNYVWSENARPINDNNVMGWMGNVLIIPTSYLFTDSIAITKIHNATETRRFIGSAEANYFPSWMPGLKFHGVVGIDAMNYKNDLFYPPGYWYTGSNDIGEKEILTETRDYTNYDLNVSYSADYWEGANGTTIIGAQLFNNVSYSSDIRIQNFATAKFSNLYSGMDYMAADDGIGQFKEAGIYLQEDLNIDETYYITFAVRNDYSSAIGLRTEAPNIFYPRLSTAIRLDKMGFTPDMINLLKFRAGYGQSGQLPSLLSASATRWSVIQSGFPVGTVISYVGNPDIEPERIQELEFGIECELWNAYGVDFTYYFQFANQSIVPIPNAPSSGLTANAIPKNVGQINTWGFESSFYATPIQTPDVTLNFNLILNMQDNEVVDLGYDQPILGGMGNQGWREGERRSSFFDYKVTGAIYDEDGNYTGFSNTTEEQVYLGNPLPTFTGSFSTNVNFLKHFSFSFMFEWATDFQVYNLTREYQCIYGNDVELNNLWAELETLTANTDAYRACAEKIARLDPAYEGNFIEDGDFIRLREIAFKIDFTSWLKDLLQGTYIKTLSAGFSVRNAWLSTKYSGVDPEVNTFGSRDNLARAVDFLTLQNARTFNFNVNIGL